VIGYNLFLPALLGCDTHSHRQAPVGRAFKFCPKCGAEKAGTEFNSNKSRHDGLSAHCRACNRIGHAEWRRSRGKPKVELIDDGARKCARCDSRKPMAEMAKGNAGTCLACAAINQKEWRKKNGEHHKAYSAAYRKPRLAEHAARKRKWVRENRERHRKIQNAWRNKKMADDQAFKIGCYLRNRMNTAIRHAKAGTSQTLKNLGCSTAYLLTFIEQQFEGGMSWDNWKLDGWHIDHIKPLRCFDLSDNEQLVEASHFRNLRPIWAKQNLSESDDFNEERQALYLKRLAEYPKEKAPTNTGGAS